MLENDRKEKLLELLRQHGRLTTQVLAGYLAVSEATVRRDLSDLDRAGQLHRIHGGAELASGLDFQIPLGTRDRENDLAKQNIASKAVKLVRDGDTVFLDASSTVYRVIPLLAMRTGLTVVTNSPKAALELASHHIRTLATGGLLLDESIAFVGSFANLVIESIRADIMLFSCRGITDDGQLCDSSLEETCIRREMLRNSKRKFLLCDSSKFGREFPYVICRREELDGIITENNMSGS